MKLLARLTPLTKNTAALISAERAYVKLSILDPGVQHRETEGQFFVTVQVKNFGRTPTTVSDARIGAEYREHSDLLPAEPPVRSTEGQARRTGFLVPGEDFMFEKNFGLGSSSLEASRSKRLWVFGYVDYVALGKRYRSGFARLYEPSLRRDIRNLSPDTERGGYDFDRKRERDEGDDR